MLKVYDWLISVKLNQYFGDPKRWFIEFIAIEKLTGTLSDVITTNVLDGIINWRFKTSSVSSDNLPMNVQG